VGGAADGGDLSILRRHHDALHQTGGDRAVSETLDIGARKELLQEPAPPPPAARRPRQTLLWTIIGIFLAAQGIWAIHAGLALRATIWPNTRSVRFQSDMMTLFFLGNGALREAEAQAKLPNLSDVMTGQPPVTVLELHLQNGAGFGAVRHLTVGEVVTGIVHFYDRSLASGMDPFGNQYFGLDYPPLRLAIATFFVRHVQMTHPDLEYFPARRSGREDTVVPKIEDIMQPMLHFNTACELAAALAIFPLVWLWVRRGAGKGLNAPVPRYPGGLAAFMLATAGFWYCYVGLSALPPRATPIVDLIRVVSNDKNASVLGTVDGGRRPAQWRVEWGTSPVYSNFTPLRMVPGIRQMHVLATLSPLTKGETIHFRLMANDAGGTSFTPDEVFTVGGPTVQFDPDPAGGIAWPGWFVWMSMLALFITMVVSARWLPPRHRAWACGLVASLLVWFDPITILDAHAWPQWDVWILPVFILAALLASMEWWICAGIILGVGCMMKGQILLGGPILLLWPIFAGKWGAAGRILTGFAAGAALVLWPWLIFTDSSRQWIVWFLIGIVLYGDALLMFRKIRPVRKAHPARFAAVLGILIVSGLICICCIGDLPIRAVTGVAIVLLMLGLPWLGKGRSIKYWMLAAGSGGVWLAGTLLGGDFAWWKLGFVYGTQKHDEMQMGLGSFANFPSLLLQRYSWDLHQTVGTLAIGWTFPASWHLSHLNFAWSQDLDLKTSLAIVYVVALLMLSFAASVHSRRNDPRILIALTAPWLLFPILMCQTSERYLLWPSALSAAFVAVSTGFSLLHVVLALFAAGMIGHQLLFGDPGRWPGLFNFFSQVYPEAGWMMLLLAMIFFVAAMIPGKRPDGLEC
jgi:hypothetical protein